jgi:hypothetical protein
MIEETPSYDQPWPEWEPLWLADNSVTSMCKTLGGMADQGGLLLSKRKLQLFAAACVRRIQHVFKDERNRRYIETVEELADGFITPEEGIRRWGCLVDPPNQDYPTDPADPHYPREDNPGDCACTALGFASGEMDEFGAYTAAGWAAGAADNPEKEAQIQVSLLRDIIGNPFRSVSIATDWLTPTVLALAQAAYDNRILPSGILDNARLAVLADALEDAGCTNADILNHFRQPGEHVRACWVVDAILAKD